MELINTKSSKEIFAELKSMHCMRALTTDSMARLANISSKRTNKANEHIWNMGESGEFAAVIMDGLTEIVRFSARDEENCLGIFGPSDVIGLSAIMNKKAYPGNAKSIVTGTSILRLYLHPILHSTDPHLDELQRWAREMFLLHEQILRDKIDILNAGQIDDRVYELLQHFIRRFGQFESKAKCRIPLNLTRAQVGRLVNGRVETIIRLISRWQKAGLLTWGKS